MQTQHLIFFMQSFFSISSNNYAPPQDTTIIVVGKAFVNKFQAGIKTDDSLVYYLQNVYRWPKKYLGKRVKVSGQLMPITPPVLKIPGSDMTPTPRLQDGRYLKNAKWKLAM